MNEQESKLGRHADPHYTEFFRRFKGLSRRKALIWKCKDEQSPWQLANTLRTLAWRRKVKVSLKVVVGGIEARKVRT